ncbi:phosphoribosyltransferase [Legionella oakridgensis]|uniref:phosphoribosyltransferase n=1 Tax=Legionella oakridgensis TaxID=29423 RepID=UPI0003DDFD97|nr:phosphoribosyltransferase [Legionella oakridgensis]ETO94300.1 putative phosphoribosyltransferase [Legionella oakridgensis RV-2-2007]
MDKYVNRQEAGKILASYLKSYQKNPEVIVLALPRGGVPVAYEVAAALAVPLDVFLVRKLGVPGHAELAMGAIATGNTAVFNDNILQMLHISDEAIQPVINAEKKELQRRESIYRGEKPLPNLQHKIVILIDDGIATGATVRAAIKALRKKNLAKLILAVPVAALSSYKEIAKEVDEFICPLKPVNFHAVGLWFEDFSQTSDDEVTKLLAKATQNNKSL